MPEASLQELKDDAQPTTDSAANLQRTLRELDQATAELAEASSFAKPRYQEQVLRLAAEAMDSREGMAALAARAGSLSGAGAFAGGPWDNPARLVPDLVGPGLRAEGVYPVVEMLSELRMLAIARGEHQDERISADEAADFLREISAKNLDLAFPAASEERRARPKHFARVERLFDLLLEQVSMAGVRAQVLEEIELISEQRPIQDLRIRQLLELADRLPASSEDPRTQERLDSFQRALRGPSEGARVTSSTAAYRSWLQESGSQTLASEVEAMAAAMSTTGLVSAHHAVLIRFLSKARPELVAGALALPEAKLGADAEARKLVDQLIRAAVFPATARCLYGLAQLLRRGLLDRRPVRAGLRRLVELEIRSEAQESLLVNIPEEEAVTANSVLVAGAISMLGQPLGIGQGNVPTCQAARGLSLWSLHAPGELLGMIATAARDGFVESRFEGTLLNSSELPPSLSPGVLKGLDPVSRLVVPHLDRLYARMIELSSYRGDDVHRWVNAEMYGRWVPKGFANTIDPVLVAVKGHRRFVRQFFASHHPEFNDGHELIYPNPVGLLITDVHGQLLGPHAVSIQRVAAGPDGEMRVYFFNPNNEGRQDWGQGIRPRVSGTGEQHGESSLPFTHFASRLYAFHFDPYEMGELYAVPKEDIDEVSTLARESWGQAYQWVDL